MRAQGSERMRCAIALPELTVQISMHPLCMHEGLLKHGCATPTACRLRSTGSLPDICSIHSSTQPVCYSLQAWHTPRLRCS